MPLGSVLESTPRPEGVFCWSDIHAVDLLNRAKCSGIDVPCEIAIVGNDDTPAARLPLIGLSSVDQQGQVTGHRAADLLLSRLDGRDTAQHELVEPILIRRESC